MSATAPSRSPRAIRTIDVKPGETKRAELAVTRLESNASAFARSPMPAYTVASTASTSGLRPVASAAVSRASAASLVRPAAINIGPRKKRPPLNAGSSESARSQCAMPRDTSPARYSTNPAETITDGDNGSSSRARARQARASSNRPCGASTFIASHCRAVAFDGDAAMTVRKSRSAPAGSQS